MMDPEIKQKWITALRSGKYQQAREALKAYDEEGKVIGYCCLGVLLEVTGHEPGEDVIPVDDTKPTGAALGMGFRCKTWADGEELSKAALKALQLRPSLATEAVIKNDGDSNNPAQSFEQISDWLESVL